VTKSNADNVRIAPHDPGLIGRTLRLLLGIWLAILVISHLRTASVSSIISTLAIFLALLVLYILEYLVVSRYLHNLNRWLGALLAWVPAVLVFVLGGTQGQVGVLTLASISLILASARGDPGCEVMSIPALIFKKHTHLVCILFSPLVALGEDTSLDHFWGQGAEAGSAR